MKKLYAIILITLITVGIFGYYKLTLYRHNTTDKFVIPQSVKRLALLGSTPHPTKFLEDGGNPEHLIRINLANLIDIDDLADSFEKTLRICQKYEIDQLIVAYLPIYFSQTKKLLGKNANRLITLFLDNMSKQIAELVEQIRKKNHIKTTVTFFLPTIDERQIPSPEIARELYTQYAVKELPHLYWNNTSLQTLFIINTEGSINQNDGILQYLRYEHLFERYIPFETLIIPKARFHSYR